MADEVVTRVTPDLDGERADKAISVLLGVSRAVARELVDRGATVDGLPVKPSDRISTGSLLRTPSPRSGAELVPEPVEFGILHEDQHLAVIDKPPGMVVHPGPGRKSGTLAAGLLHRYPEIRGVGDPGRWGIVHRLDKDTSGALIVARDTGTFAGLKSMIERREVERIYNALVDGLFAVPTGTIDAPIGRDKDRPRRQAIAADGKRAVTHYEVLREFPAHHCSLVLARLETGRTHQIRVHLAAIGHPVVGDATYAASTTRAKSPRQFLHARSVAFRHPLTGLELRVEAPLPFDLESVIAGMAPD